MADPGVGGLTDRFWRFVEPEPMSGCWLWTGAATPSGYGGFTVRTKVQRRAHRVAYELYVGPVPPGLHVCHRCDVPACVNPRHLFLGTDRDNMLDASRKGRLRWPGLKGSAHSQAKLTEAQVVEIRRLLESGQAKKAVARLFLVSKRTVQGIAKREYWAHV